MPKFTPDLSETGNEPVAEGVYQLSVFGDPKLRLSKGAKTSGQPYLTFQMNHIGAGGPPIFERVFLAGKGAFRYLNLMRALGLTENEVREAEVTTSAEPSTDEDVDATILVKGQAWSPAGKTVSVVLGIEEAQGDFAPRNNIKKFLKN